MDKNILKDMIKTEAKQFLSEGLDPKNANDILNDENLNDVLTAPDIVAQISEFINNRNKDDDSFFQGLLIGLSIGSRFGMISVATSLSSLVENYRTDIPNEENTEDAPINVNAVKAKLDLYL